MGMAELQSGQRVIYQAFDLESNGFTVREGTIQKWLGSCIIMEDGWVVDAERVIPLPAP